MSNHVAVIMDANVHVPNICPSSAVIFLKNLTYQICNTLWHFGHPRYTKPESIWINNMKLSPFAIIMDEFLVVPNICPSSAIFFLKNLTYQICDTLWHFGHPRYTKPESIWMSNMKLNHFAIIMDEFLVVPNISPSSAVFFLKNLTYQICDTLWHFGHPRYTKPESIWISNVKLSPFAIIMDEFLVVPNICPSSAIFFLKNLTYQICDTLWHFGHPRYTKLESIWMSNMKLSPFAIIMDEFLVVPNICPSSAIVFLKNLTYQICETLWHFAHPRYTKPESIWIDNMKLSHLTIIMDEFLVVPNICPSSAIFFLKNLTYQICDTLWHFGHPKYTKTRIDMDQQYELESLHNHHGWVSSSP